MKRKYYKDRPKPELVAPAGSWETLTSAIASGADAVYFGVKGFNMRRSAANFDILELKKVMATLSRAAVKGYLALNVTVYDDELVKIEKVLRKAREAGVDAVIAWDMAVLDMAVKTGLKVHLSTQASVSNFASMKVFSSLGVKRIVLARECTLRQITAMIKKGRAEGLDCEIETFIHGAMCLSVSGRCFMSEDSFGRSANRGDCLQPCRREFIIEDIDRECRYVIGNNYVLSARDLCTIRFIDRLIDSGISAFKIEGRMRPAEYVRIVTSAYREAIDDHFEGRLTRDKKENLYKRLLGVFNRGFDEGFFMKRPAGPGKEPARPYEKIFVGEVKKFYRKISVAEIALFCEGIKTGDEILVTGRRTPAQFMEVTDLEIEHKKVKSAEKGGSVGLKCKFEVHPGDKVFLWKED